MTTLSRRMEGKGQNPKVSFQDIENYYKKSFKVPVESQDNRPPAEEEKLSPTQSVKSPPKASHNTPKAVKSYKDVEHTLNFTHKTDNKKHCLYFCTPSHEDLQQGNNLVILDGKKYKVQGDEKQVKLLINTYKRLLGGQKKKGNKHPQLGFQDIESHYQKTYEKAPPDKSKKAAAISKNNDPSKVAKENEELQFTLNFKTKNAPKEHSLKFYKPGSEDLRKNKNLLTIDGKKYLAKGNP